MAPPSALAPVREDGHGGANGGNILAVVGTAKTGGVAHAHRTLHAESLAIPSQLPAVARKPAGPRAVREAALRLGIDLAYDHRLLHLAEELVNAPLPPGWEVRPCAPLGCRRHPPPLTAY